LINKPQHLWLYRKTPSHRLIMNSAT